MKTNTIRHAKTRPSPLARPTLGLAARALALALVVPGSLCFAISPHAAPGNGPDGTGAAAWRAIDAARTSPPGVERSASETGGQPMLGMRTPPRLVRLNARSTLEAQDGIRSADGRYALLYREDGNLVLYGTDGPVWESGTTGTGAGRVTMQDDGDLVIRDARGRRVWSTNSAGNPRARLELADDGTLVVRRPDGSTVWEREARR